MKRNTSEPGGTPAEAGVALRAAELIVAEAQTIGPMGSGYWYASLVESLDLDRWQPVDDLTADTAPLDVD